MHTQADLFRSLRGTYLDVAKLTTTERVVAPGITEVTFPDDSKLLFQARGTGEPMDETLRLEQTTMEYLHDTLWTWLKTTPQEALPIEVRVALSNLHREDTFARFLWDNFK